MVQSQHAEGQLHVEQELPQKGQIRSSGNDPMGMFLYAIKAKETKRQYTSKLKAFFDYLGLGGDLNEQAAQFYSLHKRFRVGYDILYALHQPSKGKGI